MFTVRRMQNTEMPSVSRVWKPCVQNQVVHKAVTWFWRFNYSAARFTFAIREHKCQ